MTHLQSRTDLIELVARQAPTSAVRRACLHGTVEVFGSFDTDPPCWIVKVTAKHGTPFIVGICPSAVADHGYQIHLRTNIPWHLWMGAVTSTGYSIMDGDHPKEYEHRHRELLYTKRLLRVADDLAT